MEPREMITLTADIVDNCQRAISLVLINTGVRMTPRTIEAMRAVLSGSIADAVALGGRVTREGHSRRLAVPYHPQADELENDLDTRATRPGFRRPVR